MAKPPVSKQEKQEPKAPLGRVRRQGGSNVLCPICSSTTSKEWFFGLVGSRFCHNNECVHSSVSIINSELETKEDYFHGVESKNPFIVIPYGVPMKREFKTMSNIIVTAENWDVIEDVDAVKSSLDLLIKKATDYKKKIEEKEISNMD